MSRKRSRRGILMFCLLFLILVLVLVPLWWLCVPWYGVVLATVCQPILHGPLGMPIADSGVTPHGFLNTETQIFFVHDGRNRGMGLALAVTNVPPYWALVLATAGLGFWRRLRVLLYGTGILFACHVLLILVLLRYGDWLQEYSEIPTAVIQFFLTLPFLLWVVFAYWDKLMAMTTPEETEESGGENAAGKAD
jgi:hypothetical protein